MTGRAPLRLCVDNDDATGKLQSWNGISSCLTNGCGDANVAPLRSNVNRLCQIVRITEEQLLWLSSQVKPFRNKSAVIRISSIQHTRVDVDAKLSATTSVREDHKVTSPSHRYNLCLSNLSALQGFQSCSSHSRNRQRLIQSAQKVEDENIIKLLKMKLKSKRPVNHALRGPRALLSLRRSGSVIKAAGIVPTVSPSPRPWSYGGSLSLMSCRQMT